MIDNNVTIVPGLIASALVLGAVAVDLRRDVRRLVSGRSVVLLAIFCWFLLEAITLSPGMRGYSQGAYNFGLFCVLLASAAFLAGYHGTGGCTAFEPLAARFRQLDNPRLLWRVVLVCAAIGLAPVAWYSGLHLYQLFAGILGMRETWGGLIGRSRYGGFREAMLMLEYFVIGAGPFAFLLLLDRRLPRWQRLAAGLIAAWPLLRAYGSGTRSSLITAVLPVLAVLFFKSSARVQRRLLVGGLLATPLVYTFMAAMVASRGSGHFSWHPAEKASYVGHEMFQELLFITTRVPEPVDYQLGYSYYVQVVNPIPRFLWPGKPTLDAGILIAQLKGEVNSRTGEANMTISPGLIGEMYLNLGLPGIALLSLLGGWLVRGWDRIPARHGRSLPTMILYSMGLATLFIMGRAFNANFFYAILFLGAGVYVVTYLSGPSVPTRHRQAMTSFRTPVLPSGRNQ